MRNLILAFTILATSCLGQTTSTKGTISVKKPEADTAAIMMCGPGPIPEFPGGSKEMVDYISKNIVYPRIAIDSGYSGKVYITFIVDTDGTVLNARVIKGISYCPELGIEALRVINSMPKWKPASLNGKPVKTQWNLPVNFTLK